MDLPQFGADGFHARRDDRASIRISTHPWKRRAGSEHGPGPATNAQCGTSRSWPAATAATATKAADILVKVHSKGIGIDPVTGGRYDSNSPESQLWIHMTAWHSILYCYEIFGPGKLSEEEETQYWAECAIAAQCQTINPDDVPRSRRSGDRILRRLASAPCTYAMRALMTAVNSNIHLYDAVWSWLVREPRPS